MRVIRHENHDSLAARTPAEQAKYDADYIAGVSAIDPAEGLRLRTRARYEQAQSRSRTDGLSPAQRERLDALGEFTWNHAADPADEMKRRREHTMQAARIKAGAR